MSENVDFEIQRIGEYETNIINIARHVFSREPQSIRTIHLLIDDKQTEKEIYLNIAWFGMKYLFGSDALPENMMPEQLHHLNKYMASMGKIIIASNEDEEISIDVIDL